MKERDTKGREGEPDTGGGGRSSGGGRETYGSTAGDPGSALTAMLTSMGHELNNSLQALELNLEVVRLRSRREASEARDAMEPHLTALASNIDLLSRRLSFLLSLAGRSPTSRPTVVVLERLTVDLLAAMSPGVTASDLEIGSPAAEVEVEVRQGYLLELLFRIFSDVRAAIAEASAPEGDAGAAGVGSRITVEKVSGRVLLSVSLGSASTAPGSGQRDAWEALARKAGGRLSVDSGSNTLILELPPARGA